MTAEIAAGRMIRDQWANSGVIMNSRRPRITRGSSLGTDIVLNNPLICVAEIRDRRAPLHSEKVLLLMHDSYT